MKIPGALMPHQVIIRAHEGTGANGEIFSAPVVARAYIEDQAGVVIDGTGQEVPTSAQVWLDPERVAPPLSEITIWPASPRQRIARVITANRFEHPGAPSHLHLHLG